MTDVHVARAQPECFEPNPKRRIDDGSVLLGAREFPVTELVAAVLARVCGEALRVTGGVAPAVDRGGCHGRDRHVQEPVPGW